jgi:hypothetical protein
MNFSKYCFILSIFSMFLIGCSKDQNLTDFQRKQLQDSTSRLNAVSGNYKGIAVSKIDNSNLGTISLNFKATTDVQASSTSATNIQIVTVGGLLTYSGPSSAEVSFSNGTYDEVTGVFKVIIPITQNKIVIGKISLDGIISGDQWNGTIEASGQTDFGATLNLTKNPAQSNTSKLEVSGTRLEQIKKSSLNYKGAYQLDNQAYRASLSFLNLFATSELVLFKIFSPIRQVQTVLDLDGFQAVFPAATIDDKMGTLDGYDAVDLKGTPFRATLHCDKYDNGKNSGFGYICNFQSPTTTLTLIMSAQ